MFNTLDISGNLAQHHLHFPKKYRNSPSRQCRRARRLAQRQKDAEEVFCSESKETKTDDNVHVAEVASKEECEAVVAKAIVKETNAVFVKENESDFDQTNDKIEKAKEDA